MAKADGRVALTIQTVLAMKGATIPNSVYLSINMDDDSNCEAGTIQFPEEDRRPKEYMRSP
jgi:hypothetical protein